MPQSERKYHIHVSKKILYLSYVKKKILQLNNERTIQLEKRKEKIFDHFTKKAFKMVDKCLGKKKKQLLHSKIIFVSN